MTHCNKIRENKRDKNLIFHLYSEGDLPKFKFRLVVYDRKQTEPQDPFWLMLLQTMFAAKAPRGQSYCGFEGKIKQLKYRDAALKALCCKGDKEHVFLLHLI